MTAEKVSKKMTAKILDIAGGFLEYLGEKELEMIVAGSSAGGIAGGSFLIDINIMAGDLSDNSTTSLVLSGGGGIGFEYNNTISYFLPVMPVMPPDVGGPNHPGMIS